MTKETKIPFWGTILTVLGLSVLIGLGTWQVQRLQWKQDILVKLDAAYAGLTDPQQVNQRPFSRQNFTEGEFLYGHTGGAFLPDKAILLGPRTRARYDAALVSILAVITARIIIVVRSRHLRQATNETL